MFSARAYHGAGRYDAGAVGVLEVVHDLLRADLHVLLALVCSNSVYVSRI